MTDQTTRRVRPAHLMAGQYIGGRKITAVDTRAEVRGKRAVVVRKVTLATGAQYDVPTDWVTIDREAPTEVDPLDYDWASTPGEAAVPPDANAALVVREFSASTHRLVKAIGDDLPGALTALEADDDEGAVLDLIVWAQTTRSALAAIEARVTEFAGKSLVLSNTGTLPDGRTYTLRRGANRKAWDHDSWKHDARAAVLKLRNLPGVLVNPESGEEVNVLEVITEVQNVHGSSAPKVTALRALGLEDDGYCETTPGAWGIQFADPIPATTPTKES